MSTMSRHYFLQQIEILILMILFRLSGHSIIQKHSDELDCIQVADELVLVPLHGLDTIQTFNDFYLYTSRTHTAHLI